MPGAGNTKVVRPANPRRSSQPRYYTSEAAIAVDSSEDLALRDVRPQTATATAPLTGIVKAEKQAKHDSGLGGIDEKEKSRLKRMSWGSTA